MRLRRETFLRLFPERRFFFIVVCLSGLLGFYLLGILPHQQAAGRLEDQIDALEHRIEEQKVLGPIYERFTRMVGDTQPVTLEDLPFPAPEQLAPEQVAGVETLFGQMAGKCQLEMYRVGADLNSMINETGELKISLEIRGRFEHLRAFMLKLAELPFLSHIERIEVRRGSGFQGLQMELDLWLARE